MGNLECCAQREGNSQYDKTIEKLEESGKKEYIDNEFPAVKESLIPDWNDTSEDTTSIKDDWA